MSCQHNVRRGNICVICDQELPPLLEVDWDLSKIEPHKLSKEE